MSLNASLSEQLPLFQLRDFDILLSRNWPVGVDSDYPSELRVRLSAAAASYQMGNKSIDNVVKRYFNDFVFDETPHDRLDKRISRSLKDEIRKFDKILGELAPKDSVLGQMVAKWTFMRVPFSFDIAITCAQRGALFECLAIIRMILEQVAWSLDVRDFDDFDAITSSPASRSIQTLKLIHPASGRFYGWLSAHAHWDYDAHIKAFEGTSNTIGMRLANSLYKAQSLSALLVLFTITQVAYRLLFASLGLTDASKMGSELNTRSLIHELQSLAPQDKDIERLLGMVETKHSED